MSDKYLKLQKQPHSPIRSSILPAQTIAFGHDSASAKWFTNEQDALDHRPDREEPDMNGTRVTVAEAAALQSYPVGFNWNAPITDKRGRQKNVPKTKQYLQIGNAVPPLLAQRILEELWSE